MKVAYWMLNKYFVKKLKEQTQPNIKSLALNLLSEISKFTMTLTLILIKQS